jgi:dTDP-4-dehydrorhamnose reductase
MKVLVIGSDGQLGLEFQKISNSYDSYLGFFQPLKL